MGGAVKTIERETSKITNKLPSPGTSGKVPGSPQYFKEKYAEHRGLDLETVREEGLIVAKEKRETEKEEERVRRDKESSRLAAESAEASALEAKQKAQREEMKRRGRRASILNSSRGVEGELGSVMRPTASSADTLG